MKWLLVLLLFLSFVLSSSALGQQAAGVGSSETTSDSSIFISPDGLESNVLAGKRPGLPFTKKGKSTVKQKNAEMNEGKNRCENCGVETVPGQQHKKGVTPPNNETQVDHVIPKAKGGDGDPENGQVLCRECNIKKSDKDEP